MVKLENPCLRLTFWDGASLPIFVRQATPKHSILNNNYFYLLVTPGQQFELGSPGGVFCNLTSDGIAGFSN